MSVVTDRRVPGVYFLPPPVRGGIGLPPLDVAAFVGYAEKGPVDLPVPIGDVNTYRAIFGGDLALAHEEGERTVYANLPQSVSAFFGNGGRRCYVVRVVGSDAATTRCRVPRLVAIASGGERHASISASSPGRWSERFRLAARLDRTPLPLDAFSFGSTIGLELSWDARAAPAAIQEGDLLRLTFGDTANDRKVALFPVAEVERLTAAGERVILKARQHFSLIVASDVRPAWVVEQAARLTLDAPADDVFAFSLRLEAGAIVLSIDQDGAAIAPGDILKMRIRLQDASVGTFLFPVSSVRQAASESSPPAGDSEIRAEMLLRLDAADEIAGGLRRVERLRFDLALRDGDQRRTTLTDLAFNTGHPSFWGEVALLESSALRTRSDSSTTSNAAVLQPGSETPAALAARLFRLLRDDERIDPVRHGVPNAAMLAGLLAPVDGEDVLFLPLDMPGVLSDDAFVGADTNDTGRDGLDRFDASSFDHIVDARLALTNSDRGLRTDALLSEAFDLHYVRNKRLRGLHSLLFVDEVALLSVAEAVQRNWAPASQRPDDVVVPIPPEPVPEPCPPEGPFLTCLRPPEVIEVRPPAGALRGGTRVAVIGDGFDTRRATTVSFGGVAARDVIVISANELHCTTPTAGIAGPVTVEVTTDTGMGGRDNAFRYLAESIDALLPELEPLSDYDIDPRFSPLLPLQRELLRVCQARADAVAILTLPRHFEKRACVEWQQELRVYLGLPRRGSVFNDVRDIADLSYAAVYHPWLLIRDVSSPDAMRAVVADGAVCGTIAARERDRQVWVAPANVALEGVLGLAPKIRQDDWAELFDAQFNLIRSEPRDFRAMSAHTLSDEAILLQLSVRRLMILLRKVAYLRGLDFVFESNHERFREGVRAVLNDMLRFMFDRGAFAGRTPQASYRVVTDASVNTPQSIDQGRFIALVQVAPSQPAEFITVVLSREGDQLQLTEA